MDDMTGILQSVQGMAEKAAAPEAQEPGPGDAAPTIQGKSPVTQNMLVPVPMSEEQLGKWFTRVQQAREENDRVALEWDILLDEYLPIVKKSGDPETVKANRHFRDVHTKMGQLFYRSPDLLLASKDPGPGGNTMPNPMGPQFPPIRMEDIIPIKQAVLQDKLGRDGINSVRLMDELLFDILAWSSVACCKVGYRCVSKKVTEAVTGPDPNYQPPPPPPGSIMGLAPTPPPPQVPQMGPDGQPQMNTTFVPIHEEWYAKRFSPKKLLKDPMLKSTRFDEDATWLGMDFYLSPDKAKRPPELGGFGMTDEEVQGALGEDDRLHKHLDEAAGDSTRTKLLHFVEIFCRSSEFADALHPKALHQLILCEGIKEKPIVWRPCVDQTFDDQGKLTPNSIEGFPFKVLTIRDLADSSWPKSDAAYQNSGIKQLSTSMRQRVKQRDANIGKTLYDGDIFDGEDVDKLKNADTGDYIPVKGGSLDKGVDKILAQTAQIKNSPDDIRSEELLRRDLDETLGIGAVQSGIPERAGHTATEINDVNLAVRARNDKELTRVIDFYLALARHVDVLLMRYAEDEQYVEITGTEGAQRMQVWNNTLISGRYLYDIAPDSQLRPDTEVDFKQTLDVYNLGARDPLVNRQYVLKKLARCRGWDPAKLIVPPSPVAPPEPKPAIAFSFKGPDLGNIMVLKILVKTGVLTAQEAGIPPEAVQEPPPPHPTQPPAQPVHGGTSAGGGAGAISKHQAGMSGRRPNEPGAPNRREEQQLK